MITSTPPKEEGLVTLTPEQQVQALKLYFEDYKGSVKKLNRRNTMAVMLLQNLVATIQKMHPDITPMVQETEVELKRILNFREEYAPAN